MLYSTYNRRRTINVNESVEATAWPRSNRVVEVYFGLKGSTQESRGCPMGGCSVSVLWDIIGCVDLCFRHLHAVPYSCFSIPLCDSLYTGVCLHTYTLVSCLIWSDCDFWLRVFVLSLSHSCEPGFCQDLFLSLWVGMVVHRVVTVIGSILGWWGGVSGLAGSNSKFKFRSWCNEMEIISWSHKITVEA